MSYWKYRAYDSGMKIREGVIVSPVEDEQAPDHVLLSLRQQGLQGIHIQQIDRLEYNREVYLQKLKDRGRGGPQVVVGPRPAEARPSIRARLAKLLGLTR